MFTANYAGQFHAFLPGLAALHLPFTLGGSSNHFRRSALRDVGGWDPYNVTEDADLGIRLARLGYRSADLPSATYEEAPPRFVPGSSSAPAGTRAGCKHGWSKCAGLTGWCTN